MFRPIDQHPEEATMHLDFEGRTIAARPGDTVASALIGAGITAFRTAPRSGARRGPFCLMGACFDCLMVIDGQPDRQACMVLAADGMTVARQRRPGA